MSDDKDEIQYTHTAYDDAFRTMEEECDDALIHFVNYIFSENYDKTAKVVRLRNEHHVGYKDSDKKSVRRVTDSHFCISYHGNIKSYQLECESSGYDGSVLVRMFQYDVQTAIDESVYYHDKIILKIPNCGLLILRDRGNPPDKVTFEILTPGGKISYEASVICESDYSIEDMFEKKLYFLLPFFAFNYEHEMSKYEKDEKALQGFIDLLCNLIERLRLTDEADLSLRTKGVIIKEVEHVIGRLNKKRINVSTKVGDVMRGRVMKLDWLERYDKAMAVSEARGEQKTLVKQVCRKLRKGMSHTQIAEDLEEDEIRIKVICDIASDFAPDYDENKVLCAILEHTTS